MRLMFELTVKLNIQVWRNSTLACYLYSFFRISAYTFSQLSADRNPSHSEAALPNAQ